MPAISSFAATPTRKTTEAALATFNTTLRASALHQQIMREMGVDTSKPIKLTKKQQQRFETTLRSNGVDIPKGMKIDPAGNLNQENKLLKNIGKAAAIGGAAAATILTAGAASPALAAAVGAGGGAIVGGPVMGGGVKGALLGAAIGGVGGYGLGTAVQGARTAGQLAASTTAAGTTAGSSAAPLVAAAVPEIAMTSAPFAGAGITTAAGLTGTTAAEIAAASALGTSAVGVPLSAYGAVGGAPAPAIAAPAAAAGAPGTAATTTVGGGGGLYGSVKSWAAAHPDLVEWGVETGANVVGATIASRAAKQAAETQAAATAEALAFQKAKYEDVRRAVAPYQAAGNGGLAKLSSKLNVPYIAPTGPVAGNDVLSGRVPLSSFAAPGTPDAGPGAEAVTRQPVQRAPVAPVAPPAPVAPQAAERMVLMTGPDGRSQKPVPQSQVDHFTKLGATLAA